MLKKNKRMKDGGMVGREKGRRRRRKRERDRREGIADRQQEGHHDLTEPERILTAD